MGPEQRRIAGLTLAIVGLSAALLALRYLFHTYDHFFGDIDSAKAYVSANGSLYGVLTAFTIFVVWSEFNDTTTSISSEANALTDLYRAAIYLEDPSSLAAFEVAIRDYVNAVVEDEWAAMARGHESEVASAAFERIFQAVRRVRFDDERDEAAWSLIIRKFDEVSDARVRRLELATKRRPPLLRGLFYLTSFGLLAGFFMLGIRNDFLRVALTVLPIVIVVLVDDIITDIDNPFGGQWAIEPNAYLQVPQRIEALARTEAEPSVL